MSDKQTTQPEESFMRRWERTAKRLDDAARRDELLRLASECEQLNIPEAAAILREEAVKIR